VGAEVDLADPDTVNRVRNRRPGSAYSPRGAEGTCIRKNGVQRWEQSMNGLPAGEGNDGEPFCHHAANRHHLRRQHRGLFRSGAAGRAGRLGSSLARATRLEDGVARLTAVRDLKVSQIGFPSRPTKSLLPPFQIVATVSLLVLFTPTPERA